MDSPYDEIEWLLITDLHVGDAAFDEKGFLEARKWVLEAPNRYVVCTGDLCNNGLKNSVSDVYSEVIQPGRQPEYVASLLAPIADRIVAITSGNHERRTKKDSDVDPTETIVDKLCVKTGVKVPIIVDGGYIRVRWGARKNQKPWSEAVYITHGAGKGTPYSMLQRLGQMCYARVYITGHKHQEVAFSDKLLLPDNRNCKEVFANRLFICAPGFLSWGGYAKRELYKPTRTGAPTVTFTSDNKIYTSIGGKVC